MRGCEIILPVGVKDVEIKAAETRLDGRQTVPVAFAEAGAWEPIEELTNAVYTSS